MMSFTLRRATASISLRGQAGLHTTSIASARPKKGTAPGPTHDSRTGTSSTTPQHPGYTDASTPITDADPREIPQADPKAVPSSQTRAASTVSSPPHPGVYEMAKGGETHGSDAITPEERNVKNWGPNQRTPEFNREEGQRQPILDGGSHQGGFDGKGKSKT